MQATILKSVSTLPAGSLPASPVAARHLRDAAHYDVAETVAPGVLRVLACNAKDYTGAGTNTYIVGADSVWIIDPGPRCDVHVDAVLAAVGTRRVEGILVTHTHLDHSPAARLLAARTGAKTHGFGALSPDILALTDEDVDPDFTPDVKLAHGHSVGCGDWRIEALHTPGHFPNHLCYYLPHQGILFSGDHLMGWSTTAVVPPLGNLADYMAGLDLLETVGARQMLPSHGDIVRDPAARICEVREHRLLRHRQVAACVQAGRTDPAAIVAEIYEALPPVLIQAAKGCVMAHMELLAETGSAKQGESVGFCQGAPL